MRSRALFLTTILLAAGCEPYKPTVHSDEFPKPWKAVMDQLVARAPFDFDCPIEEMAFKKLGNSTAAVGVVGCGKRGTYKYVNGVGWVLNAASVQGDAVVDEPESSSAPASTEQSSPSE